MSEIEDEILINEIRNHSDLYDKTKGTYKNTKKRIKFGVKLL